MNINFAIASSRTATVAGATLGIGAAYAPDFLQGFGRPVSLFFEYSHTWWQDAQFNAPPASPLFTYNFRRGDDVFKLGFSIALNPPPPPERSPMYVKAPAK